MKTDGKIHILDFEGETLVEPGQNKGMFIPVTDATSFPPPAGFVAAEGGFLYIYKDKENKEPVMIPVRGTIYIEPPRRRTVMRKMKYGSNGERLKPPLPIGLVTLKTPPMAYGMAIGPGYFECFVLRSSNGDVLEPGSTNYYTWGRKFCLGDVVPTLLRQGKMTLPEAIWETTWDTTTFIDADIIYARINVRGYSLADALCTNKDGIGSIHNLRFHERASGVSLPLK